MWFLITHELISLDIKLTIYNTTQDKQLFIYKNNLILIKISALLKTLFIINFTIIVFFFYYL